jgi:hypothetical protein
MAEQHTVMLLMSEFVAHDVKRFLISKPSARAGRGTRDQ